MFSSIAQNFWFVSMVGPHYLVHFPPRNFLFKGKTVFRAKKCLSDSSSSSIYFIHLQIHNHPTPRYLAPAFLEFLLTSVIYYNSPPTFIITPKLYLQLRKICKKHKSTQLLVHRNRMTL